MLIIGWLNCIYAASAIVILSKWPSGSPDSHLLRVTIPDAASIQFRVTIPDAASIQFKLLMMSI